MHNIKRHVDIMAPTSKAKKSKIQLLASTSTATPAVQAKPSKRTQVRCPAWFGKEFSDMNLLNVCPICHQSWIDLPLRRRCATQRYVHATECVPESGPLEWETQKAKIVAARDTAKAKHSHGNASVSTAHLSSPYYHHLTDNPDQGYESSSFGKDGLLLGFANKPQWAPEVYPPLLRARGTAKD